MPVRANAYDANNNWIYIPEEELAALERRPLPHGSPYGAPVGVPGAAPPGHHGNGYEDHGRENEERKGGFATVN